MQLRRKPAAPATRWPEHDRMIHELHLAGLVPGEIAVRLGGMGLQVRTWQVTESFVRGRQKALGLAPNVSRDIYSQGRNLYRPRSRPAEVVASNRGGLRPARILSKS